MLPAASLIVMMTLIISVFPVWVCTSNNNKVEAIRIFEQIKWTTKANGNYKNNNMKRSVNKFHGGFEDDSKRRVPTGSDPLHN